MTFEFAFGAGERDHDVEVEIDFTGYAAVPATWGYNGGTPPEPAHVELNSYRVLRINGNPVSKSWQKDADRIVTAMFDDNERLRDRAEDAACEYAHEASIPDYDDIDD